MQIFTDKDFPEEKPQFLQMVCGGRSYELHPLHISMDEPHKYQSGVRHSEHSHDVYHIVLYGSGSGEFSFKGRLISAESGLLVLSSPGEGHCFPPIRKGNLTYSEFTFSYEPISKLKKRSCQACPSTPEPGEKMEGRACRVRSFNIGSYDSADNGNLAVPFRELLELFSGFKFTDWKNVILLDDVRRPELRDILCRLSQMKESESPLRFFRFYRDVSDLFTFLALVQAPENIERGTDLTSRLSKARDYIHSHYDSRISVDRLAAAACMSKGHFQRVFKAKYGVSPVTYINQYRINAAKSLLRTTSLSCAEIAAKVGFDDIFYFSKVFKKVTDCNPRSQKKG